jgi:hypothetical protein
MLYFSIFPRRTGFAEKTLKITYIKPPEMFLYIFGGAIFIIKKGRTGPNTN